MHRRNARNVQILLNRSHQTRGAATALATKTTTEYKRRSDSPQPTPGERSSRHVPNLSEWSIPKPTKSRSVSQNKWMLSKEKDGQQGEKFGESSRSREAQTHLRESERVLSSVSSAMGKWAPQFPKFNLDGPGVSYSNNRNRNKGKQPERGRKDFDNSDRYSPRTPFGLRPKNQKPVDSEAGPVSRPEKDKIPNASPEEKLDTSHTFVPGQENEEVPFKANSRYRGDRKERGSILHRFDKREPSGAPSEAAESSDPARSRKLRRLKEIKVANLDVFIPSHVSVENLARIMDVRLEDLQRCMRRAGLGSESSFNHTLSSEDASLLAMEFGRNPVIDDEAAFDIQPPLPLPENAVYPRRPPIVTVMGHVDHGKTTLLDKLRSSSVAKGEAGGITQHIGAFSVPVSSLAKSDSGAPQTITFLDTPGHAAFSAMRARGARVTDLIILVVAADDGVKPQTKEVIDLIKKDQGKTGVVVAINKVDKPGIDVESVQTALWAEGIQLEVMGGDVPSVEVSGLTGQGLDQLVETISALAEFQDLRAEHEGSAHGVVLESSVRKGLGNTATVLMLRGRLTPSSYIICGTTFAKVRHLTDSQGGVSRSASPGDAVIVSGWKDLPRVGDEVLQDTESNVKKALQNRLRKEKLKATLKDAEAINISRRKEREKREEEAMSPVNGQVARGTEKKERSGPKELRLVIKGDVSGSTEALATAVEYIGNQDVVVKVVSSGVGEVTESDVMMAKAVNGMIIAFSVDTSRTALQVARQNSVSIFTSKVIYTVLDEVKERAVALLPVTIEKKVTGEANVIQLFDIHKGKDIFRVAGCRVSNGVLEKAKTARVIRDGVVIHEGPVQTLRILRKDVTEVKKGLECGLSLEKFSDIREGDFIQMFQEIEIPGKLY